MKILVQVSVVQRKEDPRETELKKTRYIWLKNPANLTANQEQTVTSWRTPTYSRPKPTA